MFVRKKRNSSGKISVQIIDKSTGIYKVVKTVGCSGNNFEVERLYHQAEDWIKQREGILEFDFDGKAQAEEFIENIEEITVSGTTLLLAKLSECERKKTL